MANQIDARLQLKIDSQENWEINAPDFIPKLGELIIYSPDENHSVPRFKVGDGLNYLYDLPFSNDELILKNGSPSYWSSPINANFIPKEGQIIIINASGSSPASIKIGDGKTSVKNLPVFGGAEGSSSVALSLVNEAGNPLNRGNVNNFVYFENGVPMPSDIYVWESVPVDAKFTDTTYEPVSNTGSKAGLMSVDDKKTLDNLAENAIVKTNYASKDAWGIVKIGDNLNISNGVLSATTQSVPNATITEAGLMPPEDKIKLNNIEAEANKTIVDSALNSTSTNPVENKVINSAISGLNSLISTSNQSTLAAAENFTKNQIAELIGSAPETLNTLGEIADAMENNKDVVEALDEAIGTKANASDLTATSSKLDLHVTNKNNPHEVSKAQVGLGNVENKSVATIKSEILTEENISALGFIKEVPEYTAPVTSVNGQTGEVTITAESLGALKAVPSEYITETELENKKYLTSVPSQYVTQTQLNEAIPDMSNYVEKNGNKVLSTNDFTNDYKNKIEGIEDGANYIQVDNSLTSTGTNPVQGKVIYNALGDYVTKEYLTNQKYLTGISKNDVTTALGYTPPQSDTNTTYSAGTGLSLSGTTFNIKTGYTDNNKNYKVQTDSNGNLYVNVPWENTTYTLTSTKITNALGYTPAKSSDIPNVSNFVTSTALTQTLGNYAEKGDIPETKDFLTTKSLEGYIKTISFAGTNLSVTGTTASITKATAQTALGLGSAAYKDDTDFASTDTFSPSKNGLVPKPSSSSNSSYLRADGSWGTPISYGSSASALGSSASGGSSSSASRSDHIHPYPELTSCSGILTLAKGGTGGTTKATARTGIGIYSGTSDPQSSSSYSEGDIYFKYSL